MTFDPEAERGPLAETLSILGDQDPDQFPAALGHAAMLAAAVAFRGWFAGLRDEAVPVLTRHRDWMVRSLAQDESFSDTPLLSGAQVADTLAVTTWLLTESTDRYDDAVARYESYLASDEPTSAEAMEDLARVKVGAGRPVDGPRLLTPDDARTPSELAYCASRWPGSPSIVGAGELVIARYAEEWLERGGIRRLVDWLRVVYWTTGVTTTPDKTMQRLPGLLTRRH